MDDLDCDFVAQLGSPSMTVENPERHRPAAPLESRVERGTNALQIAAVVVVLCQEINAALSPIVGVCGATALHTRSHHLCAAGHAWTAGLRNATDVKPVCEALVALLAQRNSSAALSGGDAYLQTLHDLLVSLIGPSLAGRLLRTVWPPTSSSAPAQNMPP